MNKGKDKDQRKEEEEKEGGESKSQKGSVWGAGQDGDWEEEKKTRVSLHLLEWELPELLFINILQDPSGEIREEDRS